MKENKIKSLEDIYLFSMAIKGMCALEILLNRFRWMFLTPGRKTKREHEALLTLFGTVFQLYVGIYEENTQEFQRGCRTF